jgi:acyl-CoA synthetase (AMP-forming)/AMP-acid ligase II/acyl carrier protein
VAIEHHSAACLLGWAAEIFTPAELGRVMFSTSICFDLSVFEIFVPLSRGGCVIVADNALALRDGVAGEVTLINTVPSAMRALLEANAVPPSVRCINLAGELLPQELVEAVHRACTVRLFDLYGPSEDTTYSTFALREPGGEGSIGRPIDNTRVYVLDEQGNLLPPGLTGELHIGGAGLARGYLNRPELTAERFVHNRHANERVYRTGDLVRYLPDGRLRYVGRKDHQVKIRGYRIEPGEIEAAIRRHAQVQACAVVTRHDAAGPNLVAAVVAGPEASDGLLDEVQAMLGQHLPPYMVPGAMVRVDALPLTANGKLDREAVAALHTAPIPVGRAELTETELRIARLWQRVLGAVHPGPADSFFKLGGDSLRLLQLAVQLEAEFAVPIALPTLFTRVTVASQAQWIEQQQDVRSLLSHVAAGSDVRAEEYIDL